MNPLNKIRTFLRTPEGKATLTVATIPFLIATANAAPTSLEEQVKDIRTAVQTHPHTIKDTITYHLTTKTTSKLSGTENDTSEAERTTEEWSETKYFLNRPLSDRTLFLRINGEDIAIGFTKENNRVTDNATILHYDFGSDGTVDREVYVNDIVNLSPENIDFLGECPKTDEAGEYLSQLVRNTNSIGHVRDVEPEFRTYTFKLGEDGKVSVEGLEEAERTQKRYGSIVDLAAEALDIE